MTDNIITELRKKAREDKFYRKALGYNPKPSGQTKAAAEIGVSKDSVRNLRKTTGEKSPVKRIGKVRAAEAIAQNPQKSDRVLAAELGVGNKTVSRARKATVSPDTVKRIGKDGKASPCTARMDCAHLIEAIHLLTLEINNLNATMAKPRPSEVSRRRKVFADYRARLETP